MQNESELRERGELQWYALAEPLGGVAEVVFTTRNGGRSRAPYESLNLGFHVGDVGERVRLNRLEVRRAALPRSVQTPVVGEQVHGVHVEGVGALHSGARWESDERALLATDALLTATPELPLMTLVADCLPIALVDPKARVVAAVHAGWRGLAGGILAQALSKMRDLYETDPADVCAWVGPAIGACCYEVGTEVAAVFPEHTASGHLDLRGAAKSRLMAAGLHAERLAELALCTSCHADRFFSHRRATRAGETTTGRQAMLVWLRSPNS